jgi:hypothetical protein
MKKEMNRPKIVTALGYLNIFDCLASVSLIIFIYFLSENSASETSMIGMFLFILFSILSAFVGVGMLIGQKWSWYAEFVIIGLVVYQAVGDFITYITDRSLIQNKIGHMGPFEVILLLTLCSLIIVYLNTIMVKKYFKIKT